MKPVSLLLAILLLAGCASMYSGNSARHIIVSSSAAPSGELTWTPTEADITTLESKLASLFSNPDSRLAGLPDGIPPFPVSEYFIRYSGTGPEGSRYILGMAGHRADPKSAELLNPDGTNTPDLKSSPHNFSLMYDVQKQVVIAVGFNAALEATATPRK